MKFLDTNGVRKIKEYIDGLINSIKSIIFNNEEVTAAALNDLNTRVNSIQESSSESQSSYNNDQKVVAAALNDLNDRTTALETEDSPKQRYFVGTSDQEQHDMDSYIKSEVPNPQEGDIFIPYDTSKRYTDIVKVGSETITFDNYQNQGWPSSTGTFIRYTAPDAQNAYLEIVANSTGTYKFYGIYNISSDYYEYPSFEASITSSELCSDGKYRLLLSTWVDGGILLYYTGSDPNIEINRCAPFGWSNFEYINGSWCDRSMLEQKAHEYITVGEIYDSENNYPSNSALLAHLKSYPKVSSGVSSYDSVKDKYIRFSWIEFVSQQNSSQGVSIYLRCSTSSTTPKTVQVSTSGYSNWTDKTPDTLDENGRYYVLLGTLTTSNHDLYVKGNNTSYGDSSNYCYFDISGPCYLSGDMISLVGGHTGGSDNNDISDDVYAQNYTFPYMFKNQTNIFSHPTRRLYMITERISTYGYYYTFVGCENLIVSPIISGSPKGSYALNGMFTHCYNMKVSLCNVSAMIGRTRYPWLPSGVCQTDGHVIYNPGGSYYSNYDISVETNDTYYGLFTDIINSENTILFNKVTSLVSNNSSLLNNDMLPNKVYNFGTLTSSQTFSLSTIKRPGIPHYFWTFDIGATIPNITWPSGLTWPGGSPPAILANKHYEISVLNNIVAWMEV